MSTKTLKATTNTNEIITIDSKQINETIINGKAFFATNDIADFYGKENNKIINAIEQNSYFNHFVRCRLLIAISFTDSNNRQQKAYLVNRDIFFSIVFKFRGEKAERFTFEFIQYFNKLEEFFLAHHKDMPKMNPSSTTDIKSSKEFVSLKTDKFQNLQEIKNVANGKNVEEMNKRILLTDDSKGRSSVSNIRNLLLDIVPNFNMSLKGFIQDLKNRDILVDGINKGVPVNKVTYAGFGTDKGNAPYLYTGFIVRIYKSFYAV